MSIQSEVNQGIALTSLIFNQSPLAAAGRRKGEAKIMSKATDAYMDARSTAIHESNQPVDDKMSSQVELLRDVSQRRKKEFELDPTKERAKTYERQLGRERNVTKLARVMREASTSLAEEQESKRLTTQNFTPAMSDDVKNSEVYFGKTSLGKVKDLKPTLQQSISKELEKEEKKSE